MAINISCDPKHLLNALYWHGGTVTERTCSKPTQLRWSYAPGLTMNLLPCQSRVEDILWYDRTSSSQQKETSSDGDGHGTGIYLMGRALAALAAADLFCRA